jgi:hypothetical protein
MLNAAACAKYPSRWKELFQAALSGNAKGLPPETAVRRAVDMADKALQLEIERGIVTPERDYQHEGDDEDEWDGDEPPPNLEEFLRKDMARMRTVLEGYTPEVLARMAPADRQFIERRLAIFASQEELFRKRGTDV